MSLPLLATLALTAALILPHSAAGEGSAPAVYLEDSPAAQDLIDAALAHRQRDELTQAVQQLQQVLQAYPRRLVAREDQLHEDARLWVNRRIREDELLLNAYRARYQTHARQKLTQALASEPIDEQALVELLDHHAVTEPGLEAGLTLAGLHLARAGMHSAAAILRQLAEHPDLHRHSVRYHRLAAKAAMYTGDASAADHHRQQLIQADESEAVRKIETLAQHLAEPVATADADESMPDAGQLALAGDNVLWEQEIQWDPFARTDNHINRFPGQSSSDQRPAIIPVADDKRVYINEGRRVRAMELHAGDIQWAYEWAPPEQSEQVISPLLHLHRFETAQRGVLLHDASVFAVMGASSSLSTGVLRDTLPTALVSLEADTGKLQWQVAPAKLDDAFSRGYFLGTPVAGENRIYTLVRRTQNAGFQDTFVVAVNHENGQLLWRRHLASVPTAGVATATNKPQLLSHDGMLYVRDPRGITAGIDARSGQVHWLRVLIEPQAEPDPRPTALQPASGQQHEPQATFAIVQAGLIIPATTASNGQALLVHPGTGQLVQRLQDGPWSDSHTLLNYQGDLIAIGPSVTRLDGKTLQPRWSESLQPAMRPGAARPQIVGRVLFLPANRQIAMIDLVSGESFHQLRLDETGHVSVVGPQLLVASNRALRSYLAWPHAAQRLQRRITQNPASVDPPLALATLALRHQDHDLLEQAIDAAVQALDRLGKQLTWDVGQPAAYSAQQQRLFEHLLLLTDREAGLDADTRNMLFERMALLTHGPKQEAAYHLRIAQFLTQRDQPHHAAMHLHMLLQEPALGAELFISHQVSRQASIQARQQLRELIDVHGPQVYAPFAEQAATQLRQLAEHNAPAHAFISLAERFPLAQAAPLARAEAGVRLAQAQDVSGAAAQFRQAYDMTDDPALRARLVGALAQLYELAAQPREAAAWLRRFEHQHPGHHPVRGNQTVNLQIWLAALERTTSRTATLSALNLPLGQARLLEGSLVSPAHVEHDLVSSRVSHRSRGILLRQGETYRWHTGENLAPQWSQKLPFEDAQLLDIEAEQLLLWSPDERKLAAIDADTGELIWPMVDTRVLLADIVQPRRNTLQQQAEQRRFLAAAQNQPLRQVGGRMTFQPPQRPSGPMLGVSDHVVAIVDPDGRAAAVHRQSGRVLWHMHVPMETIFHVSVDRDLLVLAGATSLGTDSQAGQLFVLDIAGGEPLFPPIEQEQPVQWVGFARDDMLLYAAGGNKVTAYRLDDASVAWQLNTPASPLTGRAWVGRDLLVLLDQDGMALAVDPQSGQLLNRVNVHGLDQIDQLQTLMAGSTWYIMTPQRVTALGQRGQVLWRDAIAHHRQTLVQLLLSRDYLVLVSSPGAPGPPLHLRAVPPDERWPAAVRAPGAERQADQPDQALAQIDAVHRIYLLDRHTGKIVAEHELDELPQPITAQPGLLQADMIAVPLQNARTLIVPGH